MKKPYNETWIDNLAIQVITEKWYAQKLISKEQVELVKIDFPEQFYRPGLFVKIGLFIFGAIACAFFVGFIFLCFGNLTGNIAGITSVICCFSFLVFLEYLIKNRKLFHSGIDNALLYAAVGSAATAFFLFFEGLEVWQYCIVMLAVLTAATLRYADIFVAAGGFVTAFVLLANLMIRFPIGKAFLPFAVMALSVVLYFLVKRVVHSYYTTCRTVIEAMSLIAFYLGGNYYVVREGNALLQNVSQIIAPQISFAPLFYFFTAVIPLFYILLGLKSKNRILLLTGLFATGFSIFTYRYYFGFLTLPEGITVSGIVMIFFSVVCIRYLKEPIFGLSDDAEGESSTANIESVLAAQYLGQTPDEKGLEFGEGDFGGGGAGSQY